MTDWWFSPDTLVSSTNKTDCHDITEILLKVALNTNNQNIPQAWVTLVDFGYHGPFVFLLQKTFKLFSFERI